MLGFKRKVNKQPELPKEVIIDDVMNIHRDNIKYKKVSYWRGNTRYSMAVKLDTVIPSVGETCPYDYLVLHNFEVEVPSKSLKSEQTLKNENTTVNLFADAISKLNQ